jgi:bifunctional DNase/RNase
MKRTLLRFENIQQVVGSEDLAVILLTDELRQRALSVICDGAMTQQLLLRLHAPKKCLNYLPEALVNMLPGKYELMIYGIHDGQYQVVLADSEFERNARIRISDAVLLNVIADYPLYIEETLMQHQCVPFDEHARGVAIPINTMDAHRLNVALQNAIETENYELASQLRDEIKRRQTTVE